MGALIFETLGFSSYLLAEVAERFGTSQAIARQFVSKLKPRSEMAKTFCPRKAENPNVLWGFNNGETSQTINFTFRDGKKPFTRGNFTVSNEGRVEYDFTLVNPDKEAQAISTRGFYDPNKPLVSSSKHGAGYDWDDGDISFHAHSTGFSNDTATNKEVILDAMKKVKDTTKQVKEFLSAIFTKERTGQMFFPGEVAV